VPSKITLEIAECTSFADGHAFGDTGAYERLRGRALYAVDPKATAQAVVTDIDKAPVNKDGLVEFTADFLMLRPADRAKGNRRVFFDYGNRGNLRALQFFNDARHSNNPKALEHAGNGFLFRRGYSFVWGAWQGDLLPGDGRVTMNLPVATDNGKPITGPVRQEFTPVAPTLCFALSGRAGTRSHPAVSLDTSKARLTKRRYPHNARIPIPATDWQFAQVLSGASVAGESHNRGADETAIMPSDSFIYMPTAFQPGWIYELVYEGRDPLVMGLGHVAVRDLVSFLKYGQKDAAGNANPLAPVEKAYGWGRSQTGRCIRDFVYLGFNADAEGRKVFDGVMPHVAGGGRMWLNHRFANGVSMAGQQYEDHYILADRFPFSYAESKDHLTGKSDAILKRPATDPHVMHSQTATEYWQRRGSLAHTDTKGNDLAQPANVRCYLWSSSQHISSPLSVVPDKGVCQNFNNIVSTSMLFRALLDAMDAWVTHGTLPPDSRIPTRKDGTLATYPEWREKFPRIPGQMISAGPAALPLLDHGPDVERGILSKEPPEVLNPNGYVVQIPATDADGNDIAGVRAPMVQAPLGTYTGWSLRARGYGTRAGYEFSGSYIPFPDSPEEREFTEDPRKSVLERYGSAEGYVTAIVAAAKRLVAERLMLEEDVPRAAKEARNWGRPRHVVGL
jgi:Alpha/beta hydrolase domain